MTISRKRHKCAIKTHCTRDLKVLFKCYAENGLTREIAICEIYFIFLNILMSLSVSRWYDAYYLSLCLMRKFESFHVEINLTLIKHSYVKYFSFSNHYS